MMQMTPILMLTDLEAQVMFVDEIVTNSFIAADSNPYANQPGSSSSVLFDLIILTHRS